MMKIVGKDGSWEHFRSSKALVKFLAEENVTAGMSEERKKEFYALMYAGTLAPSDQTDLDQSGTDPDALDQSKLGPDDVYSAVMVAAGRKATLRHFERNKPLLEVVAKGGRDRVAKKSEEERKEFYKGVYECFLFNK